MNRLIDFRNIRGDLPGGQRAAFESLVCQLAHREHFPKEATFRRVEGAGGDGGVEAYWLMPNGAKTGYQAKYFLKAGEIDWRQIDESVTQALTTHPSLIQYVVALPCDLTDRSGLQKRGKTGWEHWDTHKATWEKQAQCLLGWPVEFVLWSAFEIGSRLTAQPSLGLRTYWFGAPELSSQWFADRLRQAIVALDERYHPEDHVEVEAEQQLQFVVRHSRIIETLRSLFETVCTKLSTNRLQRIGNLQPPESDFQAAIKAVENVCVCQAEISDSPSEQWQIEKWRRAAQEAVDAVDVISRWARNRKMVLENSEDKKLCEEVGYAVHVWWELMGALNLLQKFLSSAHFSAESQRILLVHGRAGTGKSHLLARIAEHAAAEGRPVIMLLGHQFHQNVLWPQILQRLDLQNLSTDEFLGALDVAAETAGVRGLILIDAINEGPGARLWRAELASFFAAVRRHTHLACVVSCRTEYLRYLVPESLLSATATAETKGFVTLDEQIRAARVYLDRRQIVRPATPWLAPEFINPLFLRSCCNALQREGKREFPRGLTGTKEIFAFYIRSVARHLGIGRDDSDELVRPTFSSLLSVAKGMAMSRQDSLPLNRARELIEQCFADYPPPPGLSWLEVLLHNGLFRLDPKGSDPLNDPLYISSDVIRFSFQRFQDHLMAESLLREVVDIRSVLTDAGALAFIYDESWVGVHSQWHGLLEALSVQVPERFQVELVDMLPGDFQRWWQQYPVQQAFMGSLKWRSGGAFSPRTLELFNMLDTTDYESWSLLIDLSASIDHPWNAQLTHRNLLQKKMPQRDAWWTLAVNSATSDDAHPIHRLIDFCLHVQESAAPYETLRLCALVLAWCFTATSRPIRDLATKALTSVLLVEPDIYIHLLEAFAAVDDLYVQERIYAAGYGACCLDASSGRLASYAAATDQRVFAKTIPPENILLRDYARSIVELAEHKGVLPTSIETTKCTPPYGSSPPKFNVTAAVLQNIVKASGDDTISHSCCGFIGDFGDYQIEPAIRGFVAVKLNQPPPFSRREKFEQFQEQVIRTDKNRLAIWNHMLQLSQAWPIQIMLDQPNSGERVLWQSEGIDEDQLRSDYSLAEQALLGLLNPAERKRYKLEALPWLSREDIPKQEKPKEFNVEAVKRWVAHRAYSYGWNTILFPYDALHRYDAISDRPLVERIGKKYQRLALFELLCKLADNFWQGDHLSFGTRKYDTPVDLGFLRDIDPTVLNSSDKTTMVRPSFWLLEPMIAEPKSREDELTQWPFLVDPGLSLADIVHRSDSEGREWIVLHEHQRVMVQYQDRPERYRPRLEEFRLIYSIVVDKTDKQNLLASLNSLHKIDVHDWHPYEVIDGGYLFEASWRSTWPQQKWDDNPTRIGSGVAIAYPVCWYQWESHLDSSLPDGARALVPSPWLSHDMRLLPDGSNISIYRDRFGNSCFIGSLLEPKGSSALIDANVFRKYLNNNNLECLWLLVAERSAYPSGSMDELARRRTEGFCWIEDGRPQAITWNDDFVRGPDGTDLELSRQKR